MTPLLAPPCGAPNPALCLRVSNTEQATLLLVCRARREGPLSAVAAQTCRLLAQDSGTTGPLTCHGSLSELHTHGLSCAPPEGGQPGPQRLQGQCPEPRPSTAVSAVDGTRRDPVGRGAAPAPPCGCPCTRAWPRWRPTQPPSDSSEARGEVGPGWGGFASLSAGSRPQEPAPCSAAG